MKITYSKLIELFNKNFCLTCGKKTTMIKVPYYLVTTAKKKCTTCGKIFTIDYTEDSDEIVNIPEVREMAIS